MAIAGREESAHLKGAERADEDVGRPDLIERPKCKDAIPWAGGSTQTTRLERLGVSLGGTGSGFTAVSVWGVLQRELRQARGRVREARHSRPAVGHCDRANALSSVPCGRE